MRSERADCILSDRMVDPNILQSGTRKHERRFRLIQRNRTLLHDNSTYQQMHQPVSDEHTFVVCADTQFGLTNLNRDWEIEKAYSRQAVAHVNALRPRPLFCCVCGDLVDMTSNIFAGKAKPDSQEVWTENECNDLQNEQFDDFKEIWAHLDPSIALVCLCGNHDVGNHPTTASIDRFKTNFGDDYLAFWMNGTYNIVLNSNLFSDPSRCTSLFQDQLEWLEERLEYSYGKSAKHIFVFSHHPWFLYDENEEGNELPGRTPYLDSSFPDGYFIIPKANRMKAVTLFSKYGVSAAFSGHFHQNLVTRTTFGMEMIVTGPLTVVFESTGNPNARNEPKTQGIRVVKVKHYPDAPSTFEHTFESLRNAG